MTGDGPNPAAAPVDDSGELPFDAFDLAPGEFRARAAWAVRRGQALWFWPDVDPTAWRAALVRIAEAVGATLSGAPRVPVLSGEPSVLSVAAFTSGTGPLLGWWAEQGRLPVSGDVAKVLRLHLRHNRQRMARLTAESARVAGALGAAGAVPTVLKGMHTAHAYFPDPATRTLSDMDVLIAPDRVDAASAALSGCGYALHYEQRRPYGATWTVPGAATEPRSLSLLHADDPFSVDVHVTLDRNFFGSMFRLGRPSPDARQAWSVSPEASVLRQPLLALLIAAHASQGFHSLTLIRLVELVLIFRQDAASGALDWDAFRAGAVAAGGLRFVYPALKLAEDLVPGTVPRGLLAACDADATPAMRQALARLTPATAQTMGRTSVRDRFMWAATPWARARQVAYELFPGRTVGQTFARYRQALWKLVRGNSSG